MERPQCCIARCLTKTKSIKVKDIIYYLFPTDRDWANRWEKRIKDFDPSFRRKSNDIVCSLHFAKTSMEPTTRQLVDHALPIYFPQKINQSTENQRINPPSNLKLPVKQLESVDRVVICKKSASDAKILNETCCIPGCCSKFDDSVPKIHGFKFPDEPEQRKKWIFFINVHINKKIEWEESMKVCALHFNSSYFIKSDQLMNDAKPTIFNDAVARRKCEIAKQTTKFKEPVKTQSINVPMHKSGSTNQSMMRRSAPAAPIVARRLSLPYKKLPTLLPKPTVAERKLHTHIPGPNAATSVHRIASQNVVVSSAASVRPLPDLKKGITVAKPIKSIATVTKSPMPPPSSNSLITTSTSALASTSIVTNPIPISKVTPPTVISRRQTWKATSQNKRPVEIATSFKTYSNASAMPIKTTMPVISKVQSLDRTSSLATNGTQNTINRPGNVRNSSSQEPNKSSTSNNISIIDGSSDIVNAMAESGSTCTQTVSANGVPKNVYVVKNESAFQYPKLLLERILANKRKNDELELEAARMKRICIKMRQKVRLQRATTIGETIEIL